MTSVERVLEYGDLESEPLEEGKIKPKKEWPTKGAVKFDNFSFSYAKNMNNVLNELNFELKAGEKIGIVGRTGKL
jgi:ABC-type multidrug transport system fused ATPase/permease subunit